MELNCDFLKEQIVKMSGIVENMLVASTDSQNDLDFIFTLEDQVNGYHKSIDDHCFKFLALKNPNSKDLRFTIAVMKINAELERIADQCVAIKRYHEKLQSEFPKILKMKKMVSRMLKNVLDAFIHRNVKSATDTIKADHDVNTFYRELVEELLLGMKESKLTFEEGFSAVWIIKKLERIGDLTTNIAEDIIFVEKGDDVRHDPKFKSQKDPKAKNFDRFLSVIDNQNKEDDSE